MANPTNDCKYVTFKWLFGTVGGLCIALVGVQAGIATSQQAAIEHATNDMRVEVGVVRDDVREIRAILLQSSD